MKILSMKSVRKEYHTGSLTVPAVEDVSFDLNEGEFAVILGASGAGKTTLLNLLGGMDAATDGEIDLDGKNITSFNKKQLTDYRRRDVGFVFQFYNLVQNLTALENVELASQICKDPLPPKDVLIQVGLGERLSNFPAQLSGGEQQRVAIARALVNSPDMIIADEPTGNLDPARSLEIMLLFQKINELGTTVLIVTHEKELVNAFSKRVVSLSDGCLISDGMDGYYGYES